MSSHPSSQQPQNPSQTVSQPDKIFYKVMLSGVGNFTLRSEIMNASHLLFEGSGVANSIAELKELIIRELRKVLKVLTDQGYYDVSLDYDIDLKTRPVTVNLIIKPGKPYVIGAFILKSTDSNKIIEQIKAELVSMTGIRKGEVATEKLIEKGIKKIFIKLANTGYPFAKIASKKATIDRVSHDMTIALIINPGKKMVFGKALISKGPGVSEDFIKNRIKWKAGEVYDQRLLLQTLEALNNTGAFGDVKVIHQPKPPADGKLNILIETDPGKMSSMRYAGSYDPILGAEGSLFWKGKNIFGKGDSLEVGGYLGESRKAFVLRHLIPDFLWMNTDLETQFQVGQMDFPAFRKTSVALTSLLRTPIYRDLIGQAGLGFSISDVSRTAEKDFSYGMIYVPMSLQIDRTNNPAKPTEGWRAKATALPTYLLNPGYFYTQINIQGEFYYPLLKTHQLVLSGRLDAGASPSVDGSKIPADKRFYGGGFRSIRGYGYQMAGSLNAAGKPLGGLSLVELGLQLEYYFSEKLSGVGFVDFGGAMDSQWPNLGQRLFLGIGSGIRYKTDIGTLKIDAAVPINRRFRDKKAQIYFGLDKPF